MQCTISSLDDFLEQVDKFKGSCFFRGQSNKDWNLEPSIYRNENFMINEDKMLEELAIKHPQEFASLRNTYPQLLKSQHYGLPTRLLDITTNPLIALYFAVSDRSTNDMDAHVLVINRIYQDNETLERYKKTISLIATNPNMTRIDDLISRIDSANQDKLDFQLPEVFIEETSYEDSNNRSFMQGAHSIIFGIKTINKNLIDKTEKIIFPIELIQCEFIIPHNLKTTIAELLDSSFGISEKTLLISVENTTSAIKEMYLSINQPYQYSIESINSFCMDICLNEKYTYPTIEQIVHEVDMQYHIMQYRIYITDDDLRYTNFICLATHSQKHFPTNDQITFKWYYSYDNRRIYQRNDENSNNTIISTTKNAMDVIIDIYENMLWDDTIKQEFLSAKQQLNKLTRGNISTQKLYDMSYNLSNEIFSFLKKEYSYSKEKIDYCIIEYRKELDKFL